MSNETVLGTSRRDSSDWNSALGAIRRLAAARRNTLRDVERGPTGAPAPDAIAKPLTASAMAADTLITVLDETKIARDIAEIEKAVAALRMSEPSLRAGTPEFAAVGEPRRLRSVWLLIGTIWALTVLVTGGAIGTILFLLS